MPENILGFDKLNWRTLQDLPHLAEYHFHPLLSMEELQQGRETSLPQLFEKAQRQLEEFDGSIDAIIGYWDFPVSSIAPLLCSHFGLPTPGLAPVMRCEHKYWSRLEQQKIITEHPRFALVDWDSTTPPDIGFPMWLKPVKAYSSELAFKVAGPEEFRLALREIRAGVRRIGKPFEWVLKQLDLPPEIEQIGGQACLAEEAVHGAQVTVEGYCRNDEVHVYGLIDSLTYPDSSSFLCYRYPSRLPGEVSRRLTEIAARVIRQIELDPAPFNIEFCYEAERDRIVLLEINPRISQSHAILFKHVDGIPHHQCTVRLTLGRSPELPYRQGPYSVAGKWFLRRFTDGRVTRSPTKDELAQVHETIPSVTVRVVAQESQRLSDLRGQDSYSYELADIHIGAHDETELREKYERCVRELPFEFDNEPAG